MKREDNGEPKERKGRRTKRERERIRKGETKMRYEVVETMINRKKWRQAKVKNESQTVRKTERRNRR